MAQKPLIVTPKFRANFVHLYEPKAIDDEEPRYSLIAMIDPNELTEKEKKKWLGIQTAMNQACLDEFKSELINLKKKRSFKVPIKLGEEMEEYDGFTEEIRWFRISSMNPPVIVKADRSDFEPKNKQEFMKEVYSGRWMRATMTVFAYDHKVGGKGLSFWIDTIQLLDHDDPLGAVGGRGKNLLDEEEIEEPENSSRISDLLENEESETGLENEGETLGE